MMLFKFSLLAYAGLVSANPIVWQRAGTPASLDEAAVAEAQRRDDTATRAFSNVQILVRYRASSTLTCETGLNKDFRHLTANVSLLTS